MGLRITEGIDRTRLEKLAGVSVNQSSLDHLNDLNLITQDGANLRTTPQGRLLLNSVIGELVF